MTGPTLDLDLPVPALAAGPFTRAQAAAAGVTRSRLERLLRAGAVVRVLRGVHAAATAEHDAAFRAAAAGLAVGPEHVAVGRTAAWVHGADVTVFTPRGLPPLPPVPLQRRRVGTVRERDVLDQGGTLVTTPLRTALDLARDDDEPVALAVMDHLLADRLVTSTELLASLAFGPHDAWVRELTVLADDRARRPVESVLRLQWLRSRLPTPSPGLVVPTRDGTVRLVLGLPDHRFGVLLAPAATGADVRRLRDAGWWPVLLPEAKVLHSEPETLRRHLEREFHQALLAEVG